MDCGSPATCLRAADLTLAVVRTMFDNDERLRLGQIKYLTGAMANARFRVEAHAAHRTGRRVMINHFVGIGDLSQGLAFVTLLPTRFLARPFAQTRHPRRLRQPIARRRLAAVRAVQPEPALKFGDLRLKSRDLACLRATNAISSSRDGSAAKSAFIESLNRRLIPVSSQIYTLGSQNLSGSLGSYEMTWNATPAKPKAYLVIETEVLNDEALAVYTLQGQTAIEAAGGRRVAPVGGKTVAFVGKAPKRIGITEWDSLEEANAWRNSAAFKDLVPLRNKAVRTVRVYAIEGAAT